MNPDQFTNDELLATLRTLPQHDCAPALRRRLRDEAVAILKHSKDSPAWPAALGRTYLRFIEPLWIGSLGAGFLIWAFRSAIALLG
jgi:hypothetical protein